MDFGFQAPQVFQDVFGGRVFYGDVFDFFVLIDGQVVVVIYDVLFRHEEALVGPFPVCFFVQVVEPVDQVGDVVFFDRISFIIQGEAVGFHVVEPHLVGAASTGFGEYQHGGGHAGVGFEDTGGHGNHGLKLVVFYQFFTDGFVGFATAEEDAVRNDAGAAAAFLENPEEKGQEEQFCFLGVGDGFQVIVDAFGVDGAFEWRIGQAQGVGVSYLVLLGQAVFVGHVGMVDAMEHQVHGGNTEHGLIHVEAVEHVALVVVPFLIGHGVSVVVVDVFGGGNEESRGAAGGVADAVFRGGPKELHHHFPDVLRRTELSILSSGGEFPQHVFVQVALHVFVFQVMGVQFFQAGDDFFQYLRGRNHEGGIGHVGREDVLFPLPYFFWQWNQFAVAVEVRQVSFFHGFDGRKYVVSHDAENVVWVLVFKMTPPHGLTDRRGGEDMLPFESHGVFHFLCVRFFHVQRTDKHEIGQLLDHRQRIRDSSGPDIRPNLIDFIFYGSCYHDVLLV